MGALEKADNPSDPVEQTTRAAAPAPPSHWPVHLNVAGVRARETWEFAFVGERWEAAATDARVSDR